jgi:hypothetical protein
MFSNLSFIFSELTGISLFKKIVISQLMKLRLPYLIPDSLISKSTIVLFF